MRWVLRFWLLALFTAASLVPASGASVIFYSADDNSYGWCAGYSYSRGESCARQQCLQYGSRCELAIECDGGWSAAAFAYDPWAGFGASCQWQTSAAARGIALTSCLYATHALCYTSEAFDGSGSTTSTRSNEAFDLAWYVQQLLVSFGYDIGAVDGNIGTRTRAAIRQMQTAIGFEPDGQASWDFVNALLAVYGGTTRFSRDLAAATDSIDQDTVRNYSYRYAGKPSDDPSLGVQLAGLDEPVRLKVLAAILTYTRYPCAVPARSATPAPGNPDGWVVACDEGSVSLVADAGQVTIGDATTIVAGPDEDCPAVDDTDTGDGDTLHPHNARAEVQGGSTRTAANAASDSTGNATKPSPLTVGGMAPGLEAAGPAPCPPAGSADAGPEEAEPFKPSGVTVGAPPPNLGDILFNDAEPDPQ
jgi:hypothetical protein